MPAETFSADMRPAEACHTPSKIPKHHLIPMKRFPNQPCPSRHLRGTASTADEAAGNIGGKGKNALGRLMQSMQINAVLAQDFIYS